MYRGIGAFTPAQEQRFRSILPACYSTQFDACWSNNEGTLPHCAELNEMYDLDADKAAEIVLKDLPFCPAPEDFPVPVLAMIGGALVVGVIVGLAVAPI
jgi:hypothetical protein